MKTFPKEADHGTIVELIVSSGLPEENKEDILIKPNGTVTIKKLTSEVSKCLIRNLHNKKFMGRKLFCNGIVPLTPKKDEQTKDSSIPDAPVAIVPSISAHADTIVNPNAAEFPLVDIGASRDIEQLIDDHHMHLSDVNLLRRYSLSMRSPPNGSIASEILQPPAYPPNLAKAQSLLSEVREMTDRLSDFGSCRSSPSSSESENECSDREAKDQEGFKNMNDRKRGWKQKRKLSLTPSKDSLLKKQK